MAKSTVEDSSERKRISIPKADESVLAWWDEQKDPALSVRLLIRSEIERSGYTDTAYRPVAQLPRRGRPPAGFAEFNEGAEPEVAPAAPSGSEVAVRRVARAAAPVATPVAAPAPARATAVSPTAVSVVREVPAQPVNHDTFRSLDDIMNG